jgi:hypothetical protein
LLLYHDAQLQLNIKNYSASSPNKQTNKWISSRGMYQYQNYK